MQNEEEEYEEEEEIDLDAIEDEQTLIDMLDETEDVDERKRIRDRLRKIQFEIKAQREKERRAREDAREAKIRNRLKEADLKKQQTMAMYDAMAKEGSAPEARKPVDSPMSGSGPKRDLVEETIRDRLRAAEDRKKRIMAAYDHAAKTQPAGQARIVEFDKFKRADVSKLEVKSPPKGSCTFGMSGGVPAAQKAPVAAAPKARDPDDESHLDPMERAIRARVREAEERKRRTLAAYDMIAKSGGSGPKTVIMEEFKNMDLTPQPKQAPRYDPCFRGGLRA
ncbi:hypothetical protein JTE90_019762 [Oedothorax gibbosus]|uniref:Smoothelin domain-containing protein n=1 Tax=Oedothorax gibbosus TaxID=931172 RepID=A0AAV6UMZ6_9ARAC|nr:hypothetical protein JTE90_019762 [Oedothorax gibbosus]